MSNLVYTEQAEDVSVEDRVQLSFEFHAFPTSVDTLPSPICNLTMSASGSDSGQHKIHQGGGKIKIKASM